MSVRKALIELVGRRAVTRQMPSHFGEETLGQGQGPKRPVFLGRCLTLEKGLKWGRLEAMRLRWKRMNCPQNRQNVAQRKYAVERSQGTGGLWR